MKYRDKLFAFFKESAGFKFDYEIAPMFHMSKVSFNSTHRASQNKKKETCIMLWAKCGFLSEVTVCANCKEYIPDDECIDLEDRCLCAVCGEILAGEP